MYLVKFLLLRLLSSYVYHKRDSLSSSMKWKISFCFISGGMSANWMTDTGSLKIIWPSLSPPTTTIITITTFRTDRTTCPGTMECQVWPHLSWAPQCPQWRRPVRPRSSGPQIKLGGRPWRTSRLSVPPSPPDFSQSFSALPSPSWSLKRSQGRKVSFAALQCRDHPASSTVQTRDLNTTINTTNIINTINIINIINKKNTRNKLTMLTGLCSLRTTPPRLWSLSRSVLIRDCRSFLSTTGETNYID